MKALSLHPMYAAEIAVGDKLEDCVNYTYGVNGVE